MCIAMLWCRIDLHESARFSELSAGSLGGLDQDALRALAGAVNGHMVNNTMMNRRQGQKAKPDILIT
ncbi:hypothetical protein B1H58_19415 [Pantoea alhagi]|uniref:Uncharacterized protein n=1 Tax=Pantoea alhagi TaxID=1891675 RepID=A0A1W6BAC2_9GAMM|nr:hypothetical protein B1H58_19415 [Pantoea alhagi]